MSIKYTKELLNSYCQEHKVKLLTNYSNEKIWCGMSLEGNCTNYDCVNTFKKSFKYLIKNGSFCKQCTKGKNKNCVIFNWKLLQSYCSEKNIKLDKDYSKEKLGSTTRIKGICENTDCKNNFECKFRNLIDFGALCNECFYKKRTEITKKTNQERYGVEFVSQVKEVRQKAEETMLEKYGVKYTTQSKELYDKMKNNNMEKYGCEYVMQNDNFKQKVKDTNKEKYGVECSLQREEIKEKSKNTIKEKYGVEFVSQVPEIRQKAKNTNIERYGFEYATQSDIVQEKTIKTNLKKYGFERASQCKEVQNKIKETCLEKYVVENYFQSNNKKIKSINTCLEKYGVENPSQNKNIKIKKEETCMKNYGVKSPFQMEETKQKNRLVMTENKDEIQKKYKVTSLKNWGVEHPSQNPEVMQKCSKNAYKLKDYVLPSGDIIKIQGYEHYALDEILQNNVLEEDIINGCYNVPEIWYEDENNKMHRHYVDIFIPSQNRCIEIKSTWTAEKKKDCIFLKQKAGKKLGYNYEIWVYNSKGEKVECYK
jgi:hypothetical protein